MSKTKNKIKINSRGLEVAEEVGRLAACGLLEGLKFLPHQKCTCMHSKLIQSNESITSHLLSNCHLIYLVY